MNKIDTKQIYFPEQQKIINNCSKNDQSLLDNVQDWIRPRNPVNKHREFRIIPEVAEQLLGWLVYASTIQANGGEFHRKYKDEIKKIGNNLAKVSDHSDLPFQFKVVADNSLNAFCLPGGKIAFNKGLIEAIYHEKNTFGLGSISFEDKIAAVLSHEIVHGCARHTGKMLEFRLFLASILIPLKILLLSYVEQYNQDRKNDEFKVPIYFVQSVLNFVSDLVAHLSSSHHSRIDELEADRFGMLYMKRAGYNPKAAIWFQKFFEQEHPDFGNSFIDKAFELFSSHPRSSERAKANEQTNNELKNL